MKGTFLNVAMALERSDDLNMHGGMQVRSKKQGYERDLLRMHFSALYAICKTRAKKVG